MNTMHPVTVSTPCGECWAYVQHLPSCSQAPVSETAPAVLVFDRAGRKDAGSRSER